MNTADQLARMDEWLTSHPARPTPPDPASSLDEDTLRRSTGLSAGARREQRTGRYFPQTDRDGIDRDGWAWGADYGRAS